MVFRLTRIGMKIKLEKTCSLCLYAIAFCTLLYTDTLYMTYFLVLHGMVVIYNYMCVSVSC